MGNIDFTGLSSLVWSTAFNTVSFIFLFSLYWKFKSNRRFRFCYRAREKFEVRETSYGCSCVGVEGMHEIGMVKASRILRNLLAYYTSFLPLTRMSRLLNDGEVCVNIRNGCEYFSQP
jgi:hypothetical protein